MTNAILRGRLQELCAREIRARSSSNVVDRDNARAELVAELSAELVLTLLLTADERDLLIERVNLLTEEVEMLREGGKLAR